jgi:hypothetical protein
VRKNKKTFYHFFIYGLVILAGFFIFGKICLGETILKITNIQFDGGAGKPDEDFIEITNTTSEKINLKGYRLVKRPASSSSDTSIKSWTSDTFVEPFKKHLWACSKNGFAESIGADSATTQTISETNGIALRLGKEDEGEIIDSINWKDDSEEEEEEEEEEDQNYSEIMISEIYPSPDTKNGEEEFVEIINESGEEIDFSDWKILDSKGAKGKITKKEKEGNFYVFYGSFSLNSDSKGDTVFLYDKKDVLIDSQSYSSGKSQYSFAHDGSSWRWTSIPTPGKENRFDKILSGKVILPKKFTKTLMLILT